MEEDQDVVADLLSLSQELVYALSRYNIDEIVSVIFYYTHNRHNIFFTRIFPMNIASQYPQLALLFFYISL